MRNRIKKILKENDWDWADNIIPMDMFHEWYQNSGFNNIYTSWWKNVKNSKNKEDRVVSSSNRKEVIDVLNNQLISIATLDKEIERLHELNGELRGIPKNYNEILDSMLYISREDLYQMTHNVSLAYRYFGEYSYNHKVEIEHVINLTKEYLENYEKYN